MNKLWSLDDRDDSTSRDASIEVLRDRIHSFTSDSDKALDLELARWDILGSIAHVKMLGTTGILPASEVQLLLPVLQRLLKSAQKGEIQIEEGVEDIHSQIEVLLTRTLGETGKRIHAARSRNDQVLTDLKLWLRHRLLSITQEVYSLIDVLLELSERHKGDLMPGYTHMQVAMPSSFGLWFAAWAEVLGEDLWSVHAAMNVINRSPLGSAAGYGSSFPIDREQTARDLGFNGPVWNSIAAQLGRGRSERISSFALASIASTLGRMSHDLVQFLSQNYGFVSFPSELTTGSSIMPHKKNPDVFELVRGRCNRIQSVPNEITLLLTNLPSGYHRDFQLFKESLFPAFYSMENCLSILTEMLKHIKITPNLLKEPKYAPIFSVEAVEKKVREGIAFRDAYHQVAAEVNNGTFVWDSALQHTHQGSLGNLCNDRIKEDVSRIVKLIQSSAGGA